MAPNLTPQRPAWKCQEWQGRAAPAEHPAPYNQWAQNIVCAGVGTPAQVVNAEPQAWSRHC